MTLEQIEKILEEIVLRIVSTEREELGGERYLEFSGVDLRTLKQWDELTELYFLKKFDKESK